MPKNSRPLTSLTDAELIAEVKALALEERKATAGLIASLAELDARRLYLGEGFPSLFAYCTQCLHLAEHAAYNRIEVARAVRLWPDILERIADGSLTLTNVRLLAPHLTTGNVCAVLDAARHKSKREVEHIVAELAPRSDAPAIVRRLPAAKAPAALVELSKPVAAHTLVAFDGAGSGRSRAVGAPALPSSNLASPIAVVASPSPRPAVVAPIAFERYKVQFTVGRETHDKLRRAQDLMRHAVPNGDPAEIFDRALTLLIDHLERTKLAAAQRPRAPRVPAAESRHIPASVRRAVWARDHGRCAFVGTKGRCAERGFVEFHHVLPFASGGPATEENIQLRCRAHNQFEAEEVFGPRNLFVREQALDSDYAATVRQHD